MKRPRLSLEVIIHFKLKCKCNFSPDKIFCCIDIDDHKVKGGLKQMGEGMKRGMVLVMSLWDDHDVNMLWLDSNYPPQGDPNKPGIARGPCPTDSGVPSVVEGLYGSSTVKFSNIKVGAIGSTF